MSARRRSSAPAPAASPLGKRAGRLLRAVAIYAALGAVLSVGAALLAVVVVPRPSSTMTWPGAPGAAPAEDPAADRLLRALGPLPDHWEPPSSAHFAARPGLATLHATGLLRPDVSRSGAFVASRVEAGFPARCLAADRLWDSEAGDLSGGPLQSGVVMRPGWRPWKHEPLLYTHVLPLRPLAWGLAINTLVWGAGVWVIIGSARLARGRWRLARGRCPACGYPRPEDPAGGPLRCPECGRLWAS